MAITAYNLLRDLIYHLFGTDLLQYILDLFCPPVSKSCPPGAATMRRRLRRYQWQVNTFLDIRLCH